jgi:hypothetical protein
LAYYPVSPCRVFDTRTSAGSPRLAATTGRTIPITGSTCGIPSTARAFALNATVVPTTTLGFLTLWQTGVNRPLASTLNATTGTIVANNAIVPAGPNGTIEAYATDQTELILDIQGYFAPPGAVDAMQFYPVTPCRVLDTRDPSFSFGLLPANTPLAYSVRTRCGIAWPRAISLNATVVPQPTLGYLTLFAQDLPNPPLASNLNAVDGSITSNASFTELFDGGLFLFSNSRTHVILDVNGYFAP